MVGRNLRLLAAAAALGAILLLARRFVEPLLSLLDGIDGAGPAAPILFGLLYAAAVVALVPGSLLTVAAGVVFGVLQGTLLVFLAATAGASLAFLVGRRVARPFVERLLARDVRFTRIDEAIGREGTWIVLLLRLSPLVPFNLLNYGLGGTRVTFAQYLAACVGMLPGTFLYVYLGSAIGDVARLSAGLRPERGAGQWVLLAVGLLATAALILLLSRLARDALRDETGIPGGPAPLAGALLPTPEEGE